MGRGIVFILLAFALAAGAFACPTITSTNTQGLLNEIPSINTQLQTCPITLPSGTGTLLRNPLVINIAMNDGTTQSLQVTIKNKQVTGVLRGAVACGSQTTISEQSLDAILGSSNRGTAALYFLGTKGLRIQGCTFWGRLRNGIVNPFARFGARKAAPTLPPQASASKQPGEVCNHGGECTTGNCVGVGQGPPWTYQCSCDPFRFTTSGGSCSPSTAGAPAPGAKGKPANCDETYPPGHQGYTQNKATWDDYTARTDGVCQSQYGRGVPSPCAYSVQLSTQGNPYYLCWYNL